MAGSASFPVPRLGEPPSGAWASALGQPAADRRRKLRQTSRVAAEEQRRLGELQLEQQGRAVLALHQVDARVGQRPEALGRLGQDALGDRALGGGRRARLDRLGQEDLGRSGRRRAAAAAPCGSRARRRRRRTASRSRRARRPTRRRAGPSRCGPRRGSRSTSAAARAASSAPPVKRAVSRDPAADRRLDDVVAPGRAPRTPRPARPASSARPAGRRRPARAGSACRCSRRPRHRG